MHSQTYRQWLKQRKNAHPYQSIKGKNRKMWWNYKFHDSPVIGQRWTQQRLRRITRRSLRTGPQQNLQHRHRTMELGIYFDFPQCCINAFVEPSWKIKKKILCSKECYEASQKQYALRYGCMPCHSCAKRFLNMENYLNSLQFLKFEK